MEPAVSITPTIVCDDCDFQVQAEIKEYLNKSCPKCGAKDLITENDIKTHDAMCLLVELSNDMIESDIETPTMHQISVKITDGEIKEFNVDKVDDE